MKLLFLLSCISLLQGSLVLAQDGYTDKALNASWELVNTWYNETSGLFDNLWWNSANMITTLADLTAIDNGADNLTQDLWSFTFDQAQKFNLRELRANDTMRCQWPNCDEEPPTVQPKGFLNGFYDDQGWWAHAWIKVYDLNGQSQYLQAAVDIFDDMVSTGYNATCGGIWWDKKHTQNVAIANELFLSLAAHLGNRKTDSQDYYKKWASKQWDWFFNSGMVNSDYNINDGLDLKTCKNNGATVFTYNQGVILGALVEMKKLYGDSKYLDDAKTIANAAISKLSTNGVLHEPGDESAPDETGRQFKGIFMRNLMILQQEVNDGDYKKFIASNADSIWNNARNGSLLGPDWAGGSGTPSAASQSSALDALVAAAAVVQDNGDGMIGGQ